MAVRGINILGSRRGLLPGGGVRSGAREQTLAGGGPGGQRRRLFVDGGAQLLLQLDEGRHRRIGRQPAGDLEDLGQRLVALLLIGRQGRGLLAVGVQRPVKRDGQEFGVAEERR